MTKPNIIISAGRRFEYFNKTIRTFYWNNFINDFNQVYVLDDRSSNIERVRMLEVIKEIFGKNGHLITFDDDGHFKYVEKFNMIKNLFGDSEYVFLLEDDWESVMGLQINKHIDYLNEHTEVDQIMFSQRFDLQWEETKRETEINDLYWKNPFPKRYKHFYEIRDGMYMWQEVIMNNYGNNPSIFRKRVFENKYFINDHGWEMDFADRYAGRIQYMTKDNYFVHIGKNSLVDIIPKP